MHVYGFPKIFMYARAAGFSERLIFSSVEYSFSARIIFSNHVSNDFPLSDKQTMSPKWIVNRNRFWTRIWSIRMFGKKKKKKITSNYYYYYLSWRSIWVCCWFFFFQFEWKWNRIQRWLLWVIEYGKKCGWNNNCWPLVKLKWVEDFCRLLLLET